MGPLLDTSCFPHWCPEHLRATLTEPAQTEKPVTAAREGGCGDPRDEDEGTGTPRAARAEQERSWCQKPCLWRTSHVPVPSGSFGILASLSGCKNWLLQTWPFPQIQGVSDLEPPRSEAVRSKMGLEGEVIGGDAWDNNAAPTRERGLDTGSSVPLLDFHSIHKLLNRCQVLK